MSQPAEHGFSAAPSQPLPPGPDLSSDPKNPILGLIPTDSNPPEPADDSVLSEDRKQLKQILDRKLKKRTDSADPRTADSLEFPLDVSESDGRKDLSWSALLGPGGNQSVGEEGLGESKKDVTKSKIVPSPRFNALKPVLLEAQKPTSKPASSKGNTPRNKEAGKRQDTRGSSEDKEEPRGGQTGRSPRKQSDVRSAASPRSEDLGSLSERTHRTASTKQNPIVQRALKDRERRSGHTPVPLKSSSERTFTEGSDLRGHAVISPRSIPESGKEKQENVPLSTNLRLPELPKLPLNLVSTPKMGGNEESKEVPRSISPRDLTITSPRGDVEAESEIKTEIPKVEIPTKTTLKPPLSPRRQTTDPELDSFPKSNLEIPSPEQEKSVSIANAGTDFSHFPQYSDRECQTDEHFDRKLWRVLDLLGDKKVMKGLRLVGGLSQYLQSCGYHS